MKSIAVIDLSIPALFLYDVPEDYDNEQIEEFLYKQGRHLSNCSWGEFKGNIIDLRSNNIYK